MTYFQLLPASATRGKHYAEGGGQQNYQNSKDGAYFHFFYKIKFASLSLNILILNFASEKIS